MIEINFGEIAFILHKTQILLSFLIKAVGQIFGVV